MLDYSGSRDVIVNEEEWDAVLQALRTKDQDLKMMLAKYRDLLDDLGDKCFTKGAGHDNILSMASSMKLLDEELEPLFGKAEKIIQTYISEVQTIDHYVEGMVQSQAPGGDA
ncbi:MAG: hypothetical protein IJ825_07840 [Oscillospiraceae bacterium]|nr:hypothetical protein [Oscillospiraceae bacterium]